MAEMSRDAEIKGIWARYGWFYRLLRGAVLIGVGVLVGMILYAEPQVRADYVMNLFVTVLSLGATALIFDELNRKRSEDDLKRQLVDDAASMSNEIAKNAVHQLRRKGWLTGEDGLLKGANFGEANLQGAVLDGANLESAILRANLRDAHLIGATLQKADMLSADLQDAYLTWAKLQKANLTWAKLQGANLAEAKLQGTHLTQANLRGAQLTKANLEGADLMGALLQGAELTQANLQGAILLGAVLDETTRLPDDTEEQPSLWTEAADLERFTDPAHPDFWQSPVWKEDDKP